MILYRTFVQTVVIPIVFSFSALHVLGQEVSNKMVAPDSTLVLSVARVNGEIFVEMDFSKEAVFDYATVERRPEFQSSFSQCLYISYKEVRADNHHVVKKDSYPYHNSADVYYRVKLVTNDGVRIYSSVLLPSAGH